MVDFVLDDLGGPAGEVFDVGVHFAVLPLHLDGFVALGLALALQGEAAFLGKIEALAVDDLGVEHLPQGALVVKHDDSFVDADHVGSHAYAVIGVGTQGVQQVVRRGDVISRGGLGLLGQEYRIFHQFAYHGVLLCLLYKVL